MKINCSHIATEKSNYACDKPNGNYLGVSVRTEFLGRDKKLCGMLGMPTDARAAWMFEDYDEATVAAAKVKEANPDIFADVESVMVKNGRVTERVSRRLTFGKSAAISSEAQRKSNQR